MYPPDSERASLTQDKAKLQRQYRAKEADAFAELQKLLRDISQGTDVPQTRLETIFQGKPIFAGRGLIAVLLNLHHSHRNNQVP